MSSWHGPFQSSGIICTRTDFSDQFRSVSSHYNRTAYGHRIGWQLATLYCFFFIPVLLFPYDTLVFVNVVNMTRQHSHVETYRKNRASTLDLLTPTLPLLLVCFLLRRGSLLHLAREEKGAVKVGIFCFSFRRRGSMRRGGCAGAGY